MEEFRDNLAGWPLREARSMKLFNLKAERFSASYDEWTCNGGVAIISYGLFASRYLENESLLKADIVVMDEGHEKCNPTTNVAKALKQLKTARRIVLTGTPVQNHLEDLYNVFGIARPTLFKYSIGQFRARFVKPALEGSYFDSSKAGVAKMKRCLYALNQRVSKFMHRKDNEILRNSLKPKKEFVVTVRLSPLQYNLYSYFLTLLSSGKYDRPTFFHIFQSLQSLINHPIFLKSAVPTAHASAVPSGIPADGQVALDVATMISPVQPGLGGIPADWWMKEASKRPLALEDGGKLLVAFSLIRATVLAGEKVLFFSSSLAVLDVMSHMLSSLPFSANAPTFNEGVDFDVFSGVVPATKRQELQTKLNDPSSRLCVLLISLKVPCYE